MGIIYERKMNYYETDRMGIIHHSNYIRFLEEFRRFYVQIIIFLFDIHLYNESTFNSIMNVIVLYYL